MLKRTAERIKEEEKERERVIKTGTESGAVIMTSLVR